MQETIQMTLQEKTSYRNVIDLLGSGIDNFHNDISSQFVSDILLENVKFVEVVESLESILTSPDLKKHNVGLNFLVHILELLPINFFSTTELDFITQFFCSQVKQHHLFISAALEGLIVLVRCPQFSKESLQNASTTLFNHVVWQTQTVIDRRMFYCFFQYVISNRLQDYDNKPEFLLNVISSIDGERDPRNLLLLFSFLPKLYISVPLGTHSEDAFEAVSCYFPIDFHSAGDGAVTREDLVSGLTRCLLAVPSFVTFCIPLIQEKLQSLLKSAKVDSYNLLIDGCKMWPSEYVVSHFESLWNAIKQDSIPPRDPQMYAYAVQALQSVVRAIPESSSPPFITSIINSCEEFLCDVEMTLFEPSFNILLAVMQTSSTASTTVTEKLLPRLVSLLQITKGTSKVLVLKKVESFIKPFLNNNSSFCSGEGRWHNMLAELSLCLEQSTREIQEAAYSALTLAVPFLDGDFRNRLYPDILKHITNQNHKPLRIAIKCLQALAFIHSDEVQDNVIKNLSLHTDEQLLVKENIFETVCSLAIIERFHPELEQQFVNLVTQDQKYVSVAVSCLRHLLELEETQKNSSLINFLFCRSSIFSTLINLAVDDNDILNLARIIQIIVCLQSSSEQKRVIPPYAKLLVQQPERKQQMVLLNSLVTPLWPDVVILTPEDINHVIMPAVINLSSNYLSDTSALQILSSLINKSNDDSIEKIVSEHLKCCSPKQATVIHAYTTVALVLRDHPLMEHWLNGLVDMLDNEEVAELAVNGFELILLESKVFLNLQNHCKIKFLYHQRLFHLVVPRLVHNARKVHHLKVMACFLQVVPYTAYMHHVKEIVPLLVNSLDTNENEKLPLSVLRTLATLLQTTCSFLEDQIDTFIPRFLHLAIHNHSMQVRIAALQCLFNSLKFSPILLLPRKQQVLAELAHCLDDKKRLVRREAARTRAPPVV